MANQVFHWFEVAVLAAWLPGAILMVGLSFGWRANARTPDEAHRKLLALAGLALLIGYAGMACADLARMYEYNLPTFYVYRLAADVGIHHGWDHLYDLSLYPLALYFNPPPLAWLIATLSPLPITTAYTAWVGLELILVVSVAMVLSPPRYDLLFLYVLVALSLVGRTFTLVESSLIVVGAVALAWRLLAAHRDVMAGVVLAAIAVKPNLAILVPLALACAGRRRAFFAWAAAMAAMTVISIALLGTRGLEAYAVSLAIYSSTAGQHVFAMEGVLGTSPLTYLVQLLAGGLALFAAFRSKNEPIGIVVAAGLIGSALVSPTFHTYDWVAPLLAMFLLWISKPSPVTAAFSLAATLLSYAAINHPYPQEVLWIAVEAGCLAWIAWGMPDLLSIPPFPWSHSRQMALARTRS